jgi:hypothetical protein
MADIRGRQEVDPGRILAAAPDRPDDRAKNLFRPATNLPCYNFMTTVADIRAIPEHIDRTFARLLGGFQALPAPAAQ